MGKVDKNVECPYYLRDEGAKICCEGIAQTKGVNLIFNTREQALLYRRDHCIRDWKGCPIAQDVNQKWGYEA